MKKILFLIPTFGNGGAEKNLVRIVNNLDTDLYSISILCLKKTGNNLETFKPGIHIIDINTPRVYFSIFKIARTIKKIKPDIVFGWMGYLNAYIAFFIPFFNKNITWFCRESSIASLVNNQQTLSWLFHYFYKKYKRYDHIICQSNYMATDLVQAYKVPANKITIINNGIDFTEVERNKIEIISKDQGKIKLLYVGGLRKVKRVGLLIEVLSQLPAKYTLTILGSGEQYEKIVNTINLHRLHERVELITNCYNPFPYYQKADCLLLCSQFEGFPNVILEAFSCGCPAIGFNITGGANEILDNYGGYIVKSSDLKDLADEIISVCEKTDIDKGRIIKECGEKYDIKRSIEKYEQLFNPD